MMLLHMQSPQYCNVPLFYSCVCVKLSMRKGSFVGSRIHPQQPPASRLPSLLRRPFPTLSRDAHGMPKLS
ncbi:hypothetical protein BGW80DRAFT_1366254 [Lactifluus volemus]|nr:hypothetical protein BGW80DRAFT_1366254 [Lactifluus volemus]